MWLTKTTMRNFWVCIALVVAHVGCAQQAESLLIGPGDLLHIQIFDTPELEQRARVMDNGSIPLLVGGGVNVGGLTPSSAARAIEKVLLDGQFLRHPRVSLVVEEFATQKVTVIGEVRAPGVYATNTPRSVIDLLTMAGGLTELADRKVTIQRKQTHEQIQYYVSNLAKQTLDTAGLVNPGDTIVVPKAGIVYILGDVKQPGGYTMTNNEAQLSVLELLARAGGTNRSAVPSRAKLIHRINPGYQEEPLALSAMQKGKKQDIYLKAGDIVYVPFSYLRNYALNGIGLLTAMGSAAIYTF